jgi:rhamnogalacturonyl hydrolase YesR
MPSFYDIDALLQILNDVPRTSTGAISHRVDSAQYWADGVFMGPPFIAYYGAVAHNQTLLQLAYDNCRLYRDALLIENGTTGPLWGHIFDDDTKTWSDEGIWATG